jgi:hypothetical protein
VSAEKGWLIYEAQLLTGKKRRGENKEKAQIEMSSVRPSGAIHRHFVGGPASGKWRPYFKVLLAIQRSDIEWIRSRGKTGDNRAYLQGPVRE